jgi:hypothetical protein
MTETYVLPAPALQYALLEERYGLAKHAMEVYERAVKAVPKVCTAVVLFCAVLCCTVSQPVSYCVGTGLQL